MEKIIVLIEAICQAYDNPDFFPNQPYPGTTHCNSAVRYISEKMGFSGFAVPMLANEMIDFLGKSVAWKKIDLLTAQDEANKGNLVVLCRKDSPHGHVAVVRPGIPDFSQKWNAPAPKLCNIGVHNTLADGANWIFPGSELPDAYLLI